jgi:hypothetical protein
MEYHNFKEGLGYFELKRHKLWFDKRCSKLLDRKKQATFKGYKIQAKLNRDNMNNIRSEANRNFRNKK